MRRLRSVLPEERRPALKRLLREKRLLRAMECHDPLSALLAESASFATGGHSLQFDVLWASGFSRATVMSLPDAELSSLERRLDSLVDIAAATAKPIVADGDTGGDALAFSYLCRRLEQIGVSAVIVEDKTGAKRTSLAHAVTHSLEDPAVFVDKIEQARGALASTDFMIFARTEALIAGAGMQSALSRARQYLLSSADGIVIHSKDESGEEVAEFMRGYRRLQEELGVQKALVCIPTVYNHVTGAQLFAQGAQLVIYGNHMVRAAFHGMRLAARSILEHDRSLEADAVCAPLGEVFDVIGVGK